MGKKRSRRPGESGDPRRREALRKLAEIRPYQAIHAQVMQSLGGPNGCFVCGDDEDTDWYRWTDSSHEALLCPDCVRIQQNMYSSGSGDHLIRVVRK